MNVRLILAIVFLMLLFGCIAPQPPANATTSITAGVALADVEKLLEVDSEEPQLGAEELLLPVAESE
ncbi:MAG: hypothetical protein QXG98_00700 [Candidatus Micrarchaeia archaeon]